MRPEFSSLGLNDCQSFLLCTSKERSAAASVPALYHEVCAVLPDTSDCCTSVFSGVVVELYQQPNAHLAAFAPLVHRGGWGWWKPRWKTSCIQDKDREVITNYCHGQNSHELGKINFLPLKIQLDGENKRKRIPLECVTSVWYNKNGLEYINWEALLH